MDGAGAVNTRGDVVIYTAPLPSKPDGIVVEGRRIRVLAGGSVVSEADYDPLVSDRAAVVDHAVVAELRQDGTETRSTVVGVSKGH